MSKVLNHFKGLIAAPATPVHANGELNLAAMDKYVAHLVSAGVYGVYVCGTTGEGPSFTVEERKRIAEAWIKSGKNKLKYIIIQVGGCNVKETQELAAHAESAGAHAIATLPPLFFRPNSVDELVEFCKDIASAAPNTPFFYYNFPAMTNVNVSIPELLEKVGKQIPTFTGVKYTSIDCGQLAFANMVENGRYNVMQGYDDLLGSALMMGSHAAVGAMYNFCGLAANRLIENYKAGNISGLEKEQSHISQLVQVIAKHGGGVPALKAAIDLTAPFSMGPPRGPLRPLSDDKRQSLARALENLGYKVYTS